MAIDPDKLLNWKFPEMEQTYTERDTGRKPRFFPRPRRGARRRGAQQRAGSDGVTIAGLDFAADFSNCRHRGRMPQTGLPCHIVLAERQGDPTQWQIQTAIRPTPIS